MKKLQTLAAPTTATLIALTAALALAGCANPPTRPTEADGRYCYNPGRSNSTSKTCTPTAVPSPEAEAKARQFTPVAGAAVLYVVRNHLNDSHHRLPVSIDGQTPIITVPASVARVVLAPGQHRVSLEWEGKRTEVTVSAAAGEVAFVEVEGSTMTWGSTFSWYAPDPQRSRQRAGAAKLVADLDLRR